MDFLEYLLYLQNGNVNTLNLYSFMEIFDEDYMIPNSLNVVNEDFNRSELTQASQDETEVEYEELLITADNIF